MHDDSHLWNAAREGDERARQALAELAAEVVTAFLRARGVYGEETLDLVQDAQSSLLDRVASDPEPPGNLRAFLKYRGYWAFGKYVRAQRRKRQNEGEERLVAATDASPDPWQGLHHDDLRRALHFCRERLGARLKEICSLRYDQGLSCGGIAERLGITENAVRLRVFHANQQLRECLLRRGVSP